ncbi:YraN family protein [Stutzerimonas stutzeri]|uniref:YraN family protein n=1 Tax=Stutzerimonas sp. S1 TaxID=3030652 RepID=UPI0022254104|nr:YraN family protein [Stutzerimonas sp. S1]MCW3149867.1 YraN family protein [Stutzerimonas sp. S1]
MNDKHDRGRTTEALALDYLARQGLRLLAQNWSCRSGELDLVMLDGDTVVFVEVRYRRHAGWGGAAASIDGRKQQRLIKAAELFLQKESRWARHPCRFDVVALDTSGPIREHHWIRNAFDS